MGCAVSGLTVVVEMAGVVCLVGVGGLGGAGVGLLGMLAPPPGTVVLLLLAVGVGGPPVPR